MVTSRHDRRGVVNQQPFLYLNCHGGVTSWCKAQSLAEAVVLRLRASRNPGASVPRYLNTAQVFTAGPRAQVHASRVWIIERRAHMPLANMTDVRQILHLSPRAVSYHCPAI